MTATVFSYDIHRPMVQEVISQDVPPYTKILCLVYYTTFMISNNGTVVLRLQCKVTKNNEVLPIELIFYHKVLFSQTPPFKNDMTMTFLNDV